MINSLTLDDINMAASLVKSPPIKRNDIVVISLDDWAMNTELCEQLLEMCAEYGAHAEWSSNMQYGKLAVMRQPELKFEMPIEYHLPRNDPRHWSTFGAPVIGYPVNILVDTI